MNPTIEKLLNQQTTYEHQASLNYLNMATWADMHQYCGAADFLYRQSKEERTHMMKIINYLIVIDWFFEIIKAFKTTQYSLKSRNPCQFVDLHLLEVEIYGFSLVHD